MGTWITALCLLQATPAPAPGPGPGDVDVAETNASEPPVEPWPGTVADGIRAMRERAEADDVAGALELSERVLAPTAFVRFRRDLAERTSAWSELAFRPLDPLLDGLGLGGWPDELAGEVHYARGRIHGLASNAEPAVTEFERAAALAGPGTLRLDALYDAGTTLLAVAEALYAQVPEVGGVSPAPGLPGGPPGSPGSPGAPAAEDAPDPLDLAEAAFSQAKRKLVRRLRADWRDEDTRANLEWIQRRLAEIDELRRQREEQEQEQEQQPNEESSSDEQPPQDEPQQDDSETQEDESSDDSESEPSEDQQESEGEPESEDPQESPDESREQDEPSEADAPEPQPEDEPGEESAAAQQEEGEEPAERLLTREEVMRLLDRLEEIEKKGEELRARLRSRERREVEEDW